MKLQHSFSIVAFGRSMTIRVTGTWTEDNAFEPFLLEVRHSQRGEWIKLTPKDESALWDYYLDRGWVGANMRALDKQRRMQA